MKHEFMAFDLGASSGRAISGILDNGILTLEEIHRFPNQMMNIHGSSYWNIMALYEHLLASMKLAAEQGKQPESVAVDTWGVDFALLDKKGKLLGMPYAYRDHRTDTAMEEVFRIIPKEKIFELTGIAFWQFNSLYQLYAWKRDQPDVLGIANRVLFMPDIFNYFFTGQKRTEFTFATTSQLYNPRAEGWEALLFKKLKLPVHLMCDIVQPGILIGPLSNEIAGMTGLTQTQVASIAAHDTGSAVAAIPAEGDDWAFISSGTWSLMGMEIRQPVINQKALDYNFTNEGGVGKTFRFLKNIMGLWLLQECKRIWASEGKQYSYPELIAMAEKAEPFTAFINPDWLGFYNPDNMPESILLYLQRSGQKMDMSPGQMVRCILESLAMQYRKVLDQITEVSGKILTKMHIIGGGAQNELLCRFAASVTGIPVITGPTEATALGNLLVQAMAKGYVRSLDEIRQVVRNSVELKTWYPENPEAWENAYHRYLELTSVNMHIQAGGT
jgi:rhamnulokinase